MISIGFFFLLALVATSIGALTPLSTQEANSIHQDLEQVRQNISIQYVFGNNFMLCLVMFIPIIGPLFGFYVLYNTGVAISAETIVASAGGTGIPSLLVFFTLFLFPFTWMEFISYSTSLAESVWLIRRGMHGLGRREIKNAAVLIAIVAVILLLAAIIEVALIAAMNG